MIVGCPLIRLSETGSTMELASRLAAEGATSGTVVLAGHQTAGRGRAGRTWATEPDTSILLSFVAHTRRPRDELGALSLLLGLAVSRTVDHCTGATSAIKWPNDVLVGGRKIAGILAVSKGLAHREDLCLIAGIGLNVNDRTADLPDTGTSLAIVTGATHALEDILNVLLSNLTVVVDQFETGETGELWPEIGHRLAFRGETVRIEDGPRTCEGILQGASDGGLLELQLPSGEIISVAAGDLTRGPVMRG